jgi:hypothetical protein
VDTPALKLTDNCTLHNPKAPPASHWWSFFSLIPYSLERKVLNNMQIVLAVGQISDSFNSSGETIPQNTMKTLQAYVTRIDENTIKFSNTHPSGSSRSKYWCEDFTSEPSLSNVTEATYADVEALVEREGVVDIVLNHCH